MDEETLTSLSETVRQLIEDGADVYPMEDEYMCSIMYPGRTMSYVVVHLATQFISKENILSLLNKGMNIVDSLRFY